jgi:hypothetical protein
MTAKAGKNVRPLRGLIDRHDPARQLDAAGSTPAP